MRELLENDTTSSNYHALQAILYAWTVYNLYLHKSDAIIPWYDENIDCLFQKVSLEDMKSYLDLELAIWFTKLVEFPIIGLKVFLVSYKDTCLIVKNSVYKFIDLPACF